MPRQAPRADAAATPEDEPPLVLRWLASLRTERRLSAHTAAAYRRDLACFVTWTTRVGITDFAQLRDEHVRAYAAAEHRDGLAPRSIQRRLSAIRTFFRFLIREGVLVHSPAVEVRAPKAGKRLPGAIDVDRMSRLLDTSPEPTEQAGTDPVLAARDHAILELFYSSGLRLAELVGLDLGDVDLADRTVRVLGKGSKERIVPVGEKAAIAFATWLKHRPTLARSDDNAAFIGCSGRRLGRRAVQLRVGVWARRQGLDVHVHPHLFRHSFATHLLESSHDLRGVQELLGHANIATTQVYTHLDFQHLANIYDATHPRARRRPR